MNSQATSLASAEIGIMPFRSSKLGVANTRIGDIHIRKTKIGGVFHEGKR
jgi:hypothetical protein